jgi:hypothetical protein
MDTSAGTDDSQGGRTDGAQAAANQEDVNPESLEEQSSMTDAAADRGGAAQGQRYAISYLAMLT